MDLLKDVPWEKVGVVSLLVIAVVGAIREWWVPGVMYRRAIKDRDRQTDLCEQATDTAAKATDVAERLTRYPPAYHHGDRRISLGDDER